MQRKGGRPCYPGMQQLTFRSIPASVAQKVRASRLDDFGHRLHVQKDQASPCRVCLRITKVGEPVLLLTHNPFGADYGPYSEVGPIFIHAEECAPYADVHALPPDFAPRELVLRAYNHAHAIEDSVIARPGEAERAALRFFENPHVAYIHVRHTTYGCFDFMIERNTNGA